VLFIVARLSRLPYRTYIALLGVGLRPIIDDYRKTKMVLDVSGARR
jgi:hypothetical protein